MGSKFSLDNVAGLALEDKKEIRRQMLIRKGIPEKAEKQPAPAKTPKAVAEKPQKRAYKPRETGLPEGCILASDFAKMHGVNPRTFVDHMIIGKGPGLIGASTDTIPERDRVDYSERQNPSRPKEKEKYLTSEQQLGALDFWKRHGVPFTMPDAEQEAKQEAAWYLPD